MQIPHPGHFEKIIEVKEPHLDLMNHVNNVQYVQWVQDIAEAHWNNLTNTKIQEKYAWVVMKHTILYKAPAFLGDKIQLKTHVKKSKGATSVRIVKMYDLTSQRLLIEAETNWCLLLKETLRPCRIPDEITSLFHPFGMEE